MQRILMAVAMAGACSAGTAQTSPKISSFLFRDAPVEYAMSILSETWGRHVVVNDSAKNTRVRTYLRDIDCASALKAVCHAHGLWYREDPDSAIIYVQRLEEFVKGSSVNERKFLEVVTVAYQRAEDLADSLQEVFRDMVVYTQSDEENGDDFDDISRALNRMDQLGQRSTILEGNASSSSSRSSTSSRTTTSRRRTRQGVREGMDNVTEYQDDMDRLNRRVSGIGSDEGGNPIPLTPNVVFVSVVKRSNTIILRSADNDVLTQVKEMVRALDRPKPQVLLEMRVISLDVTDEKDREIDFVVNENHFGAGFANAKDGAAEIGRLIDADDAVKSAVELGASALGVAKHSSVFQLLNNHYQVRLKMLDKAGKTTLLATPSLLVADNEASRVFVGTEKTILEGMRVTITTKTSASGGLYESPVYQPETERREIGMTLVLTPKVHADGTVTIRIMQESSEAGDEEVIYSYSPQAEEASQGGTFKARDIKKQIITSTVVAKSGETIALGGLMQRSEDDTQYKIPLLGDIPYLGWLFRGSYRSSKDTELMVVIRPTVILAPEAAKAASETLLGATVRDADNLREAFDRTREERRERAKVVVERTAEEHKEAQKDKAAWPEWL